MEAPTYSWDNRRDKKDKMIVSREHLEVLKITDVIRAVGLVPDNKVIHIADIDGKWCLGDATAVCGDMHYAMDDGINVTYSATFTDHWMSTDMVLEYYEE